MVIQKHFLSGSPRTKISCGDIGESDHKPSPKQLTIIAIGIVEVKSWTQQQPFVFEELRLLKELLQMLVLFVPNQLGRPYK